MVSELEGKPNFIIITTHDTGAHFSCYGGPVATPNIDAMAKEGVLFTNHFSSAPQCSPSRGSILTGKLPHVHGLMGLVGRAWRLPKKNKTLPKILHEAGYTTALVGLQHEHVSPKRLGYERSSPRDDYPYHARIVVQRFHKFLRRVETGAIKQPFFCSLGIFETHRPFKTEKEVTKMNKTPRSEVVIPPYLPDTPVMRDQVASFEAMVRIADEKIGEVLQAVRDSSIHENTIVAFTVDHGWAFPRAKCTLYDAGIKTALIWSVPGAKTRGSRHDGLVSNMDIMPTVLELAGVPFHGKIQGRSLAGVLLGNKRSSSVRREVFAEMTYHDRGYNPIRAVRTKEWKYIANFKPLGRRFEMSIDIRRSAAGKAYLSSVPSYMFPRAPEELYDLKKDPFELENLAVDPGYKQILSDLRRKLLSTMIKTSDPVLGRRKPRPPAAMSRKMLELDSSYGPLEPGFYSD